MYYLFYRVCTQEQPSIGKSMFGGYSEDFMSNMVLQGCRTIDKRKVVGELQKAVKVRNSESVNVSSFRMFSS